MDNFSNSYNSPDASISGDKKFPTWLIVLGVLILIGLVYLGYQGRWFMGGEKIDDNSVLYQEKSGELTNDFPKELLLEEGVVVSDSYSISYLNEDISLPVASYYSGKSMEENVKMFGDYLENNGWQVLQDADAKSVAPFFYAKKDTADLNITFQNKNGKVYVVIAYSVKK